jgi:hypothetical protein
MGLIPLTGTSVYLVILQDRHCDVQVWPYLDEADAIARAEAEVAEAEVESASGLPVEAAGLTGAMRDDGWVWYAAYGSEGDHVRVIERKLQGGQ